MSAAIEAANKAFPEWAAVSAAACLSPHPRPADTCHAALCGPQLASAAAHTCNPRSIRKQCPSAARLCARLATPSATTSTTSAAWYASPLRQLAACFFSRLALGSPLFPYPPSLARPRGRQDYARGRRRGAGVCGHLRLCHRPQPHHWRQRHSLGTCVSLMDCPFFRP